MREFVTMSTLSKRGLKIFLRDKPSVFFSMLAPLLTILLYVLFLKDVQISSILAMLPQGIDLPEKLINALIDSWMLSGVLSIACFTVSFGANTIMVTDKSAGFLNDINASPVKNWVVKFSYFISNFLTTVLIVLFTMVVCFVYLVVADNWYLSFGSALMIIVAVILGSLVSTLFTVLICDFFKTNSQHSAFVGIISSIIGFIMGVYMPIRILPSFVSVLSNIFPGTYPASLMRYYFMNDILNKVAETGITGLDVAISDSYMVRELDWFNTQLNITQVLWVLIGIIVVLFIANYLLSFAKRKKNN